MATCHEPGSWTVRYQLPGVTDPPSAPPPWGPRHLLLWALVVKPFLDFFIRLQGFESIIKKGKPGRRQGVQKRGKKNRTRSLERGEGHGFDERGKKKADSIGLGGEATRKQYLLTICSGSGRSPRGCDRQVAVGLDLTHSDPRRPVLGLCTPSSTVSTVGAVPKTQPCD